LNLKQYYENLGRKVNVYGIRDLVFDTWELFEAVLSKSDFLKELTIKKKENREEACRIIETELRSNKRTLTSLWKHDTFEIVMRLLDDEDIQRRIFGSDKPLRRLRDILSRIDRHDLYNHYWMPIMRLFNENEQATEINRTGYSAKKRRITIRDLMTEMFEITTENIENRPLTFIDLSSSNNISDTYWDEDIEQTIVNRLFQTIYQTAVQRYEISKSLNCLVMLDEAHRFANKELHEDDDSIVVLLGRYIRETRKFGVGWMFITTSLADMDRAIVDQTGVRIFGYGLSMGPELARLKECVTDPSDINFYLTFPHPLNALEDDQRIYSYMITGPISPLSNNYSPIFISA
jgi:hypothetical protein